MLWCIWLARNKVVFFRKSLDVPSTLFRRLLNLILILHMFFLLFSVFLPIMIRDKSTQGLTSHYNDTFLFGSFIVAMLSMYILR